MSFSTIDIILIHWWLQIVQELLFPRQFVVFTELFQLLLREILVLELLVLLNQPLVRAFTKSVGYGGIHGGKFSCCRRHLVLLFAFCLFVS